MIKRAILAACVAAFAFAALPAIAAAEEPVTNNPGDPFLEGAKEGTKFTAAGEEAKLTGSPGTIKCKKNAASGEFFDPETGSLKLIFEECTSPLGTKCTTPGEKTAGTITTTTLPFHLKTVIHEEVKTPGVLITPGPNNEHGPHFATFECGLVGKVEVGGNGIVGTITEPPENGKSNKAKISFASTEPGTFVQTHRFVIEHERETKGEARIEYDLKARLNGGETKTAAEDAIGTMTFAEGMEPTLKTTPTP